MIDLWPRDLQIDMKKRAPVTLLTEQASLPGQKTRNLVEAEVRLNAEAASWRGPEMAFYDSYLVAPALGPYRFRLFRVRHGIPFYPLFIEMDEDVLGEIRGRGEQEVQVDSEEEFLEILRKIFASQKTRAVIQAILAQVE